MEQRARKFVERATRYVLRPTDRSDMRFSLEHSQGAGGIEHTLLINLSESGAAFVVHHEFAPKIGDRIKVEIPIPQGDRIAWWGRVVRTQVFQSRIWFLRSGFDEENRVLVALRFEKMPEPFTRELRRGLNKSILRAMRDQQYLSLSYYQKYFIENFWRIMLWVGVTLSALAAMWFLTQPSNNYDPNRGDPWVERFKIF